MRHRLQIAYENSLSRPWPVPADLNLAIEALEKHGPRITLAKAINAMAFGLQTPASRNLDGFPNLSYVSRRRRAATALFEAAADSTVIIFGSIDAESDVIIPIGPDNFRVPRNLGNEHNSIQTDLDRCSWSQFNGFFGGKHHTFWNVFVDTKTLVAWLRSKIETNARQCTREKNEKEIGFQESQTYGGDKYNVKKAGEQNKPEAIAARFEGVNAGQPSRGPYNAEKRNLAKEVLHEAFPDGVPSKTEVPNAALLRSVTGTPLYKEKVKSKVDLSDDTILRTAGRRK